MPLVYVKDARRASLQASGSRSLDLHGSPPHSFYNSRGIPLNPNGGLPAQQGSQLLVRRFIVQLEVEEREQVDGCTISLAG